MGWIRAVVTRGTVAAIRLAGSTVAGKSTRFARIDRCTCDQRIACPCGAGDTQRLARKTIVAAGSALAAGEVGKEAARGTSVENVHSIADNNSSCATHQRSSSAPQSAPPSAQHTPPDSQITQSPSINNSKQNHTPLSPPANMANPCSGSDVAANSNLATLSAAVVQRPLLASKMSTSLPATLLPAQRIIYQRSSPAPQSAPPSAQHTPPDSHITQSPSINNSKQNHIRTSLTACENGQSLLRQ